MFGMELFCQRIVKKNVACHAMGKPVVQREPLKRVPFRTDRMNGLRQTCVFLFRLETICKNRRVLKLSGCRHSKCLSKCSNINARKSD